MFMASSPPKQFIQHVRTRIEQQWKRKISILCGQNRKNLSDLSPTQKNAMKGSYQNGMKIKKENEIEYVLHLIWCQMNAEFWIFWLLLNAKFWIFWRPVDAKFWISDVYWMQYLGVSDTRWVPNFGFLTPDECQIVDFWRPQGAKFWMSWRQMGAS